MRKEETDEDSQIKVPGERSPTADNTTDERVAGLHVALITISNVLLTSLEMKDQLEAPIYLARRFHLSFSKKTGRYFCEIRIFLYYTTY